MILAECMAKATTLARSAVTIATGAPRMRHQVLAMVALHTRGRVQHIPTSNHNISSHISSHSLDNKITEARGKEGLVSTEFCSGILQHQERN